MLDFKGLIREGLNLFPKTKNHGVQDEPHAGGIGAIQLEVLQPDGQWLDHLPIYEYQNIGLEKMNCVTFSLLNNFEILSIRQYGEQFNFNDRFTAKMSGTTFYGNSLYKVFQSTITDGVTSLWDDFPNAPTWNEYYQNPPQDIKEIAKKNLNELQFGMKWIPEPYFTSKLKEALKYSPLWVTLYAYGPKVNGIYQKADYKPNHAVTLIGYKENEYWLVFDHYKGNEIRKIAWDYPFGACANITFKWLRKEV